MKITIEWDANYKGVHIKTNTGLSLIVSGQPSMVMNWDDAVRFYNNDEVWKLPTREHLKLISKNINDVNTLIVSNGGYEITGSYWTADEYNEDSSWVVCMDGCGITGYEYKEFRNCVRPVSAYQK